MLKQETWSQSEPNTWRKTHVLIGHRVIPPEESCSDVVSHHHIHSVVVMSQENAEHPNYAKSPANPVIPPESPRWIWKQAKIIPILLQKNDINTQKKQFINLEPNNLQRLAILFILMSTVS